MHLSLNRSQPHCMTAWAKKASGLSTVAWQLLSILIRKGLINLTPFSRLYEPDRFFAAMVLLALVGAGTATAAPALPIVYQDANILVRSGIAGAGSEAIHLGDAFSFVVEVEFDAGEVRVEMPDDEWFQRAIAGLRGLRPYDSLAIAEETRAGDRIRVTSHWRLQALDCPGDELSCPGSKRYELPIMTIGYELTAGSGTNVDSRSARFRPWPGELAIASAIAAAPAPDSGLTDLLPGGAHAPVLDAGEPSAVGSWLLPAGVLLVLLSLVPPPRAQRARRAVRRGHDADARWEQAIGLLESGGQSDEEWSDGLRRAVTWYCLDELGVNPHTWLGPAAASNVPADAGVAAWRDFFLDVLEQHGIGGEERRACVGRFRQLCGPRPAAQA